MSGLRQALGELPDAVFADLLEGEEGYVVLVDVPGASADSLDVRFRDGMVHVELTDGKTVPEGFEYRSAGRPATREFSLPVPRDCTAEDAAGTVERGVLELRLPRRSESTGTTISVDAG